MPKLILKLKTIMIKRIEGPTPIWFTSLMGKELGMQATEGT